MESLYYAKATYTERSMGATVVVEEYVVTNGDNPEVDFLGAIHFVVEEVKKRDNVAAGTMVIAECRLITNELKYIRRESKYV